MMLAVMPRKLVLAQITGFRSGPTLCINEGPGSVKTVF
jgi:hypothetical protein